MCADQVLQCNVWFLAVSRRCQEMVRAYKRWQMRKTGMIAPQFTIFGLSLVNIYSHRLHFLPKTVSLLVVMESSARCREKWWKARCDMTSNGNYCSCGTSFCLPQLIFAYTGHILILLSLQQCSSARCQEMVLGDPWQWGLGRSCHPGPFHALTSRLFINSCLGLFLKCIRVSPGCFKAVSMIGPGFVSEVFLGPVLAVSRVSTLVYSGPLWSTLVHSLRLIP